MSSDLVARVDDESSKIRFEQVDFSIAELARLDSERELLVSPEYQRLFRWTPVQQSQFLESLILGLPVPPIVMFQNDDGNLELIDGLQRVTTSTGFILERETDDGELLELRDCDLLPSLNGLRFRDLPPVLQLELKRRTLRALVIKRTNQSNLRYQMFKRLNAGGSKAEPQEIRNASLRIFGVGGTRFLDFVGRLATFDGFRVTISRLDESALKKMGDKELALRFVALKHDRDSYRGNITDFLDGFSEKVIAGEINIDYATEEVEFDRYFQLLADKFEETPFLRHKGGSPKSAVAPAYFEAVTMGLREHESILAEISSADAKAWLSNAMDPDLHDDLRVNVGPSANGKNRLLGRIAYVSNSFLARFLP
jgi:hypothetical protein